jgi:hypothetical protein
MMTQTHPDPEISKVEQAALNDPAVMAAVREAKAGDRAELRTRQLPGGNDDPDTP